MIDADGHAVRTDIPARLDRLPLSRFHLLIVAALGISWILDGLEVTLVGAIGPVLQSTATLHLSVADIGAVASCYVAGAVGGALLFGWITDRFGRRVVFFITLAIYLTGVMLSACAWNFWSFALFRMLTGVGIGGEYAAINSAIDELIPARYRGRIDLLVNGSFWIGAAAGAAASPLLLDPHLLPVNLGWRVGFAIGGVLGLSVLFLRSLVPESPRWLVTHGRVEAAEATVADMEARVAKDTGRPLARAEGTLEVHPHRVFGFRVILKAMLGKYRERSLLALSLMVAQAFLYNAVFFTYGVVLTKFEHVAARRAGLYLLPLTLGNVCGPLLLGPLFDTVGRKTMIAGAFALSGLLLAGTAVLFGMGLLDAVTQTLAWMVVFFFASAAASSAYLTASEIFPLETRALAIATFYALGTLIGGVTSPLLFGRLIATGSAWALSGGYGFAAVLMLLAAGMELKFGIAAEGKSLESLAEPLSAA